MEIEGTKQIKLTKKRPKRKCRFTTKSRRQKQKDALKKKYKKSPQSYVTIEQQKEPVAEELNPDDDDEIIVEEQEEEEEEKGNQGAFADGGEESETQGEMDEREVQDKQMVEEIGHLNNQVVSRKSQKNKKSSARQLQQKKTQSGWRQPEKPTTQARPKKKKKAVQKKTKKYQKKFDEYFRQRIHRSAASNRLYKSARVHRAKTQKMYLLSASRISDKEWNFQVFGASGSTYLLMVNRQFLKCGCMDFRLRHRTCKHLYFIFSQIAENEQIVRKVNQIPLIEDELYDVLDQQLRERLRSRLEPKKIALDSTEQEQKIDFGEDNFCAICFDNLEEESVSQCNTCKKYLHQNCIDLWIQKNTNCPLCRSEWKKVPNSPEETADGGQGDAFSRLKRANILLGGEEHSMGQLPEDS